MRSGFFPRSLDGGPSLAGTDVCGREWEVAAFDAAVRCGGFFFRRTDLVLDFLGVIGVRAENIAHRRYIFSEYYVGPAPGEKCGAKSWIALGPNAHPSQNRERVGHPEKIKSSNHRTESQD